MRKIILVLCLTSLLGIAHAANLGQMRNDVRYRIVDTTTTASNTRYSEPLLNYRLNQVQNQINQEILPIYNYALIDAVTGQREYHVSSDTAKIDKVVFLISASTNSYQKLTCSTIQSLDNDRGITWESLPPSLPLNYYSRGNVIGLVPAPSGRYAIPSAIKVYYYQQPGDMANDSDLPFNGIYNCQPYSELLVLGVVIQCKMEKGMDVAGDVSKYNFLLTQFSADVKNVRPDSTTIPIVTTNPNR